MFEFFAQLSQTLKKGASISIDNNVFALHYRLSVLLLVLFTVIIGSRKYFGDPIDCSSTSESEHFADNYCWFKSYIIVPRDLTAKFEDSYHPWKSNEFTTLAKLEKNPRYKAKFLHAYQWIEFIVLVQAVLFFIPRYLWRYCWEHGRIKAITQTFNFVMLKDDDKKEVYVDIAQYLLKCKKDHFEYACKFIVCEFLNFFNVLFQLVILSHTLGLSAEALKDEFLSSESNHNEFSPIALIFPNLARCEIPFSRLGGITTVPELCVLPVNVFVTKIYIFLWFYFVGLTMISGLSLIYRAITCVPFARIILLKRRARGVADNDMANLRKLDYGDWFMLSQIGKNMDPFAFKNLLANYNAELKSPKERANSVPDVSVKNRNSIVSAMYNNNKNLKE